MTGVKADKVDRNRNVRVTCYLTDDEKRALDDFVRDANFESTSDAIRWLVRTAKQRPGTGAGK